MGGNIMIGKIIYGHTIKFVIPWIIYDNLAFTIDSSPHPWREPSMRPRERERCIRLLNLVALLAFILAPGLVLAADRTVVAELWSADG